MDCFVACASRNDGVRREKPRCKCTLKGLIMAWPGAGKLYAEIGIPTGQQSLAIRDLRTVLTRMNGEVFLGVEGIIVNQRGQEAAVPPIRLAILDAAGHELYTWQIASPLHTLVGGDSLPFRARLAAPPQDGRDVVAHFVTPDEMVADR